MPKRDPGNQVHLRVQCIPAHYFTAQMIKLGQDVHLDKPTRCQYCYSLIVWALHVGMVLIMLGHPLQGLGLIGQWFSYSWFGHLFSPFPSPALLPIFLWSTHAPMNTHTQRHPNRAGLGEQSKNNAKLYLFWYNWICVRFLPFTKSNTRGLSLALDMDRIWFSQGTILRR